MTRRTSLYASCVWTLAMTAAVPALAQTPLPERAVGADVSVTLADGTRRRGELVRLDATEVVIREKASLAPSGSVDSRYPLAGVRLVERVNHKKRNGALIGLGIGLGVGAGFAALGSADEGTFGAWFAITGPLFSGIGAGAGVGLGAIGARATASRRIVYAGSARTVSVAPIAAPTRTSVAMVTRW